MKYIFIGMLLSSTVTSQHDTREACEGRAKMLNEKGVVGKCVERQTIIGNSITNFHNTNPQLGVYPPITKAD